MNELVPLWRRALTAEVCWLDSEGTPSAIAATPVLAGGIPYVALPYARASEVVSLHDGCRAAFSVTDSRSLRGGGRARAAVGTLVRSDDTDGDFFTVELLRQELVKYPPSRALADSPLLCRENWWWLPRILLRLSPGATVELPARTNAGRHALLARERDGELALDVVDTVHTVDAADGLDGGKHAVRLRALPDAALRGDGAPAVAFGYDYSMPDFERWESWSVRGRLLGDRLESAEWAGRPEPELGPLPLLQRIRRQRSLGRACRRGLAAAEDCR